MPRGALLGPGSPGPRELPGTGLPVLALHGFGGTPREVDLVLNVAQARGLPAFAPLLAGHGTSARELARTRFEDWAADAEAALAHLLRGTGAAGAVVVGLSMGSLLAVHLAHRTPERVVGLGLLANALWLGRATSLGLALLDAMGAPDLWFPKLGPDLGDAAARRTHLTYDVQPLHAALSVWRAGRLLRPTLASISHPTLILHGARDRVTPVAAAWRARALLQRAPVTLHVLPRSRHILTRDVEREEVAQRLDAWLAALTAGALTGSRSAPR